MAWHRLHWCARMLRSKTGRMVIMLILTVGIATAEIVYGIGSRSQLLIADGLFSLAEGIALVGSLLALRYAKAERLHAKNTFGWARLELLAGLLQEVLLLSLSLSIIIDAINKFINPNHIENPSAMIFLGAAGVCIGFLGLFLFRGYHHDHNIGNEIVEQKKMDFVQSVFTTLRHRDNNRQVSSPSTEEKKDFLKPSIIIDEIAPNMNDQRRRRHDLILPSLNDTYANAFVAADEVPKKYLQLNGQQSIELCGMMSKSRESMEASTFILDENKDEIDDGFQESRVYATLHALCLHSFAVLLESSIVLFSGLLNKFVPSKDHQTGEPMNTWLKYIDPILTLFMVVIIAVKAIPVIWSLGHILVEAVPSGIDTHQLIQTIMKTIPQIRAVHSVHVWRATARDVFATMHVVCSDDLALSTCTDVFGRQLQKIFETHCIRHYTLQLEYIPVGENIHKCAYGARRRHRGHQSSSDDNDNTATPLQIDPPLVNSFETNHHSLDSKGESV